MNNWLNNISRSFDKCDINTRVIILLGFIIVIFLIWLFALAMPMSRTIGATNQKLQSVQIKLLASITVYDSYQSIIHSPTEAAEKKIRFLESELEKLQHHPLLMKKTINTPEDLKTVLQAISETGSEIILGQIHVLSSEHLTAPKNTILFSQKIAVEFTGDYFNTIRYLNYLNTLPWYLSFDSLDYQVDQYPNARVKLIINALSTEQGVSH